MKINFQQLSIMQLHDLLKSKIYQPEDLISFSIKRLKTFQNLNAVVTSFDKIALKKAKELNLSEAKDNPLFAIPFVTKDNIATIGQKTTGSSGILDNFVPYYDSTVNSLLTKACAINLAKTALDELGMGGDGLYAKTGHVYNPWNTKHITGGSSSGSAALVAAGVVPFALGTDTGDSIRKPAAFCGIVGYKPTYGLISRNGVFPYAPSLDTVGFFTNHVEDVAVLLDTLVQEDHQDFTSLSSTENNYFNNLKADVSDLNIAVLNYEQYQWSDHVKSEFDQVITNLKAGNAKVTNVNWDQELLNSLLPVYMTISFAEATSCHAGLDGVNFGKRVPGKTYLESIINSRSQGFGDVVKRRYVIGGYVLSELHQEELYLKAKKVRRVVANKVNELFKKYDAFIIMPSTQTAPTIKDVLAKNQIIHTQHQYMEDLLLLANLSGCPSITIPLTVENELPIGININSAPFKDQCSLNIAKYLRKHIMFHNKLLGDDDE